MNRNTKIALGIVGALTAGCAGLAVVGYQGAKMAGEALTNATTNDPDQIAAIAAEIADFDLPPGYAGRVGMDFMGNRMASFGGASASGGQPQLMLMEYPAGGMVDSDQLKKQMSASSGQQHSEFVPVETRDLPIRGETSTVTRSRGTDDYGDELFQEVALFKTDDGLGLFMALGPVATWNQTVVDNFLSSLR